MPDSSGAFKGISLTGKAGDAWTRIFRGGESYHDRRLTCRLDDLEFADAFFAELDNWDAE